jgi:glycosyltransferase involved in cell wall biosynthesis
MSDNTPSSANLTSPSIALIYDNITTDFGGAEVVLSQLHLLYPDAPLFTTVSLDRQLNWLAGITVKTSFLQRLPLFLRRRHQLLAAIAPLAIESLDVSDFDIVISISAGAAKGILTRPDQFHICYLLSPTRYLYHTEPTDAHPFLRIPGIRQLLNLPLRYLRWWDQAAIWRPDHIIAISKLVAERTAAVYRRPVADIIYPPFRARAHAVTGSTDQTVSSQPLQRYFIVISRLVWYKNIQLVIAAALQIKHKLIIAGTGPYRSQLIKAAGQQSAVRQNSQSLGDFLASPAAQQQLILFCGSVSDPEAAKLLHHSRGLVMLGIEDYGMTAMEAVAAGKPVICNAASGVAEVLSGKQHGLLLSNPTPSSVAAAMTNLKSMNFSYHLLKRQALRYSDTVFRQQFAETVTTLWQVHKGDK